MQCARNDQAVKQHLVTFWAFQTHMIFLALLTQNPKLCRRHHIKGTTKRAQADGSLLTDDRSRNDRSQLVQISQIYFVTCA